MSKIMKFNLPFFSDFIDIVIIFFAGFGITTVWYANESFFKTPIFLGTPKQDALQGGIQLTHGFESTALSFSVFTFPSLKSYHTL